MADKNTPCATIAAMDVRRADATEIDALARLWYEGWHDGHSRLVPPELTRLRTYESFRRRLAAAFPDVYAVGRLGAPVGFHVVKGDELYQLFVAAEARGSGVAAALIADAEERLHASGVSTAWLACAIGNDRAARFYEKSGWRRVGTIVNEVETDSGPFSLEVWRYEKQLG